MIALLRRSLTVWILGGIAGTIAYFGTMALGAALHYGRPPALELRDVGNAATELRQATMYADPRAQAALRAATRAAGWGPRR